MVEVADIPDEVVREAARGAPESLELVSQAMTPKVRLMVAARLAATPSQFHAVEDISQLVMVGLTEGVSRLERQTFLGLKAFASGIVSRKVADYLRRGDGKRPSGGKITSLDSTVAGCSTAGPLWQFLSSSGTTPLSAVDRSDRFSQLMSELGRLKPDTRELITLAFFDQLTTAEIAERLDITRPAASMQLLRAVKTLRRAMTGSSQIG